MANSDLRPIIPERDLQIHATIAFNLNIETEEIEILDTPEDETAYLDFIKGISHEVSTGGGRTFLLNSPHTEVISIANAIISSSEDIQAAQLIANRLLRAEIDTQEQINRLGKKLHEGLLIVSHITDRGVEKFIICKAETLSFIERESFKQKNGFPLKKKIFKSAQLIYDENKSLDQILVDDIGESIPKYWWDDFLEVKKQWADEENTKKAFSMIENKVLNKIKQESKADYWSLRNTTIHYFRSNEEFEMERYIETCINPYTPEKEDLDMNKYINTLKELPEKHKFDSKFSLVKKIITAKIRSIVKLNEDIDLLLKREVNVGDTIQRMENARNEKGIFIKSTEGYNEFFDR